jgi:hypothetical protein
MSIGPDGLGQSAVEPQHALIAFDNAAAGLLSAGFSAAGGAREPWARESGRHTPGPEPSFRAGLDLMNVADVGVPSAATLPTGLVLIEAGELAFKPAIARPSF